MWKGEQTLLFIRVLKVISDLQISKQIINLLRAFRLLAKAALDLIDEVQLP